MTKGQHGWLWIALLILLPVFHVWPADTSGNTVAEELKEDLQALTPYSVTGATVKREPLALCMGFQPFEFLACGPMTTIRLELMPGMYGSMQHTTTQGGVLAQFMSMISAMQEASDAGTLEDLARKAGSMDGSTISIAIPLIDYGFSGSFSNASISMNRANSSENGGSYQAIGPNDSAPGGEVSFPLSGKVTIDEYTPTILRGSFSGGMVDLSQVQLTGDNPVLPIHKNLSGSFNIIAPWRGDDRARVVIAQTSAQAVIGDVNQAFAGGLGGIRADTPNGNPSGNSSAIGSAVSSNACDCSCNYALTAAPACNTACAGTFAACKGIAVRPIDAATLLAAENLQDIVAVAVAELRKKFIDRTEILYGEQATYQDILASQMNTFDAMDGLDAKTTFYITIGGKAECPPPPELASSLGMTTLMFCR